MIENVRLVPDVRVLGYHVQRLNVTDAQCGGHATAACRKRMQMRREGRNRSISLED